MNIEYLEYFYKVALAGSISRVAKDAHISQSALSQQISKLEETLGCKLLERSNKGVELTDKGMIVLKYADIIIRTYNSMLEELKTVEKNNRKIKIEACWSIATYSLPCVMYRIKNKFPNYTYELNPNDPDIIEKNVINNICDLGVIYNKPVNEQLSYHYIGVDRLELVASSNYRIDEEIHFKDLLKHPFIMLKDKTYLEDTLIKKMDKLGFKVDDLKILYNSDSVESVKSSVLNEFGIAFLPYTAIKKELYNEQLKLIKIKDFSIRYDMYLIYDSKSKEDQVLHEFIEYFKKVCGKYLC